jgi:hypothetical protein
VGVLLEIALNRLRRRLPEKVDMHLNAPLPPSAFDNFPYFSGKHVHFERLCDH